MAAIVPQERHDVAVQGERVLEHVVARVNEPGVATVKPTTVSATPARAARARAIEPCEGGSRAQAEREEELQEVVAVEATAHQDGGDRAEDEGVDERRAEARALESPAARVRPPGRPGRGHPGQGALRAA